MMYLIALIPLALVFIAFTLGFSWYLSGLIAKPERRALMQSPRDYDLGYESFTVHSCGHTLAGWFIPAAAAGAAGPKPAVILVHGWGKHREFLLPQAEFLQNSGLHAVLFDVRGHGESDHAEIVTLVDYCDDLANVLRHVAARPDVDSNRMVLFGHSMGAAACLITASRMQHIRCVVSNASFADLPDLVRRVLRTRKIPVFPFAFLFRKIWEIRASASIADFNPLNNVDKAEADILLVQGQNDTVINPNSAELLCQRANSADKYIVEGKGHDDLFKDLDYKSRVLGFIKEAIATDNVT